MSSMSQRKESSTKRSFTGTSTLANVKTRFVAVFAVLALTTVLSAGAFVASANQPAAETTATQSGFLAATFNDMLSFFGLVEAAPAAPAQDDAVRGCDAAPDGLLACYRADNDTLDSTGVHHGEWAGVFGYAAGRVGTGAFNFNGSGYVVVADTVALNPANITVDGWVNLSTTDGTFGLVSKGDAYSLQVRSGRVFFVSRNAEGVLESLEARGSVKANDWVHIAATHDGTTRRIYINGAEAANDEQAGLFTGSLDHVVIGVSEMKERTFTNLADEVKIFGRALTEDEIKGLARNAPDAIDNVSFTINPNPVNEDDGVVSLTINRVAPNNGGNSIWDFSFAGGTATPGASCTPGVDYIPNNAAIVYGPGDVGPKSINVTICDDALAEGNETFNVTLNQVAGGAEPITGTNPQTVTILDDDVTVSLTAVNGVPPASGGANTTEEDPGFLDYTFSRTGNTAGPVSLTFNRTGTADDGDDGTTGGDDWNLGGQAGVGQCAGSTYSNATNSGVVVIPAGQQSCQLRIVPIVDTRVEPDETVILTITQTGGPYIIGAPNSGTGVIQNDDFAVIDLGADSGDDLEGDPGAQGTFNFDFDRTVPAGSQTEALTVTFAMTGTAVGGTGAGCLGNGNSPIDYSLAPGQTDGATFDPATCTGTVTFAAGDNDADVQFVATTDRIVEPDETIILTVVAGPQTNNSNRYTIAGDISDDVDIDDDDEDVTVTTLAPGTVSEAGPGSLQFLVQRNRIEARASDDDLVVNFSLAGTANGGAGCPGVGGAVDYTVSFTNTDLRPTTGTYNPATCTGTVNFLADVIILGQDLSAIVVVTPINDVTPENDETVTIQILPGDAAGDRYGVGFPNTGNVAPFPANSTATGTITNDDITVSVMVTPAGVLEGNEPPAGDDGGVLTYTFTRLGETPNGICVNFDASGSASAVVAPGEPNEDYTVEFGAVDPCNSFTPAPGTSNGTIWIPGGLGAGFPAPPAVQQNSSTLIVRPTDDNFVEPNEEVQIQVNNGVGYAPGTPAQASGLIINDDSQSVNVTAITDTAIEGGPGASGTLVYQFCRVNGDNTGALTFTYNVSGATTATPFTGPASADDIQNPPFFGNNVGTIPAGQACTGAGTNILITPVADATVEPDEVVRVTVIDGTGYNAGLNGDNNIFDDGTIVNDDTTVTCAVQPPSTVVEGGDITFTCTRVGGGASGNAAQSLNYTLGGTATPPPGGDYTVSSNTFDFGVGSNTANVVVSSIDDALLEADETVTITVATQNVGAQGFYLNPNPTVMTGTILNNDQTVAISGGGTVLENSGNSIAYTFTRNYGAGSVAGPPTNALAGPLTVNFTVNAGNQTPEATAPGATSADCNGSQGGGNNTPNPISDFNFSAFSDEGTRLVPTGFTFNPANCTGSITFPGDDTVVVLLVTPINDSVTEPDENVVIALAAASGGNVYTGTGSVTGVIANDDTDISVSVELCQNNTPPCTTGVNPPVVAGTGTAAGSFGAAEGNANNLTDNSLTPHGSTAVFTVTRTGNLSGTQLIDISTIPTGNVGSGTATSGAPNTPCGAPGVDYITDGKTLTFAPGESIKYFYVAVCGDLLVENNETIVAQLTNPQPPTGNPGSVNVPQSTATWTIFNDDSGLFFRANNASATEGNDVSFTVCLYTTAGGQTLYDPTLVGTPVTFTYTTVNNTATAPADYAATTGSGTIPAGSNCSAPINVPTVDDIIFEGTETFFFNVTNTTPGSGVGGTIVPQPGTNPAANGATPTNGASMSQAVGSILDNDAASRFSIRDVRQAEGNGGDNATTFNFPLTLNGPASIDQTVCWVTQTGDATVFGGGANPATPGATASGTADYTAIGEPPSNGVPNCFTFVAGSNNQTVNIPVVINGDTTFEPDETFSVILGTVTGGVFTPLPDCPTTGNPTVSCAGPNPDHAGDPNYNGIGIGTIQNDDLAPVFTTLGAASVVEHDTPGNANTINLVFPVQVVGAYQNAPSVTYTVTSSGTNPATLGANCSTSALPAAGQAASTYVDARYPGSAQTFTFSNFGGANTTGTTTTGSITVPVCGDLINEANETLTLTITSATGATTSGTLARTGTIIDNDQAGAFFFSDANGAPNGDISEFEGTPPAPPTLFNFYLSRTSGNTQQTQVVTAQTVDGTATVANNDYVARTCTFTFAPGDLISGPCAVTVNPDAVQEGDESFTLQITDITNLGNNSAGNTFTFSAAQMALGADFIAQGTIVNDDGNRIFTVRNVTELEGTDNVNVPPGTKNFVFRVEAQGQSVQESFLTYQVITATSLPAGTQAATLGTSCAGTVDVITTVQASTGVTAGVGTNTGTIRFAPSGGTGAGNEFVDILVPVCMDTRDELNELFWVQLTSQSNATVSGTSGRGIGTIIDDDSATYSLVASTININEGNVPGDAFTSNATITIQQNGVTQNTTPFTYYTVDGTAVGAANCSATPVGGNPDYRSSGTQQNQTPGAANIGTANGSTGTIQIPICGDTVPENDESFTVVINVGGQMLTATVNIINDDGPIITPPGPPWEGDINRANPSVPGPGDGTVDNLDLFWYNQFAQGLHCPSEGAGGEFQRLDGNDSGGIDAGDYTYIFNRWIGLAPLEVPKGPTQRPAGLCTGVPPAPSESGKDVDTNGANAMDNTAARIVSTGGQPGQQVLVPVIVESDGNLLSMGVNVTYDPAVLSISGVDGFGNPDVLAGPGASPNQVVGVNSTTGNLIVGMDFAGNSAPAVPLASGTRQVIFLRFTINANAAVGTTTPVTITPGTAVDVNGNVITGVTATSGTVTVGGPRSLVIGDSSTSFQQPANVPVRLNGAGGEFGVSFTVNFDPALASITAADVTFAQAVSGANCSRTIASQQAAIGRLGISIACDPQGAAIPTGTLANLRFLPSAAATPGSTIPVTFGDVPLQTNVSGATGAGLPFTTQNGTIFILGPTSSSVSVTGRVVTESGAPVRGAIVSFRDSEGNARTVTTSSLGYYEISGIEAGQTYVVTASARRYRFQARIITVDDSLTDVNLVGIE